MAGALPAMEGAFIAERHATEMGTVAINDQPLIFARFHAVGIRLRITQGGDVRLLCRFDFGLRAVDIRR